MSCWSRCGPAACAAPICMLPRETYPYTGGNVIPGHEVVAEVVALGAEAGDEFAVGDRVGVAWLRHTCGECTFCTSGRENLCPRSRYTGWDADGGYAEYMTVPAAFAHPLPPGIPRPNWPRCSARVSSAIAPCCGPTYRRRPTRDLRLRRQRTHHRSGGPGPRRRSARDDPRCSARELALALGAASAQGADKHRR